MKEPRDVNELYKYIAKYFNCRHRITKHKYAHVEDTNIIKVSPKKGDAKYVLERRIYLDETENGFMTLSYKRLSDMKKWRISIDEYERSA